MSSFMEIGLAASRKHRAKCQEELVAALVDYTSALSPPDSEPMRQATERIMRIFGLEPVREQ